MVQPLPAGKLAVGTGWRYSKGGKHAAFDYPVGIGTPVFAVQDGVVLDCHDGVSNKPQPDVVGAPSNWVLLGITHAGREASVLYQHLSPKLLVKKGQKVKAGDQLAESGSSGHATGPHLHMAAMWGHRTAATRYDYLANISDREKAPNGTAANDICIFPPDQVCTTKKSGLVPPFSSGEVFLDKLSFGVTNSDSVKRLQFALNTVKLVHGRELKLSGNYDIDTKNEATKWQIQIDHCVPNTRAADGNIGPKQAQKLFGPKYTLKAHS
ncbi:M23 family metallopeptidase [Kribbella sp. NPDC058245]|uniref:M23 family metallopeptidase n=1 Tax=Kribbella sp. NPDC058245 TaxID=3346399 RepID=UPI0036EC1684